MRTETIKLYQFPELSEDAKQKVLSQFYDINVSHDWYDSTYEDALQVGLKIGAFDIDRGNFISADQTMDAFQSIKSIIENHGKDCDTHILASEWYATFKNAYHAIDLLSAVDGPTQEIEEFIEESENEYFSDLKKEYLSILKKDYEYLTSEEAITETIIINEYEFTENGKLS